MTTLDTSKPYRIISLLSGQAVDIDLNRTNAGAQVIQYPFHNLDNEKWTFVIQDGYFFIRSVSAAPKVLGVKAASLASNADVVITDITGSPDQMWTLEMDGDGCTFAAVNKKSGKLLAVRDASYDQSAHIVQYPRNGSMSQKWIATLLP